MFEYWRFGIYFPEGDAYGRNLEFSRRDAFGRNLKFSHRAASGRYFPKTPNSILGTPNSELCREGKSVKAKGKSEE